MTKSRIGYRGWFLLLFCGAAAGFLVYIANRKNEEKPLQRPTQNLSDGYTSSAACLECHPNQHASWHASYHRTMTQLASPESILGPFEGERVEADAVQVSFTKTDGKYVAHLQMPKGKREEKPVVMTTGSHYMQLCWTPTGWERQLEIIPFAYLKEDKRWVPRRAVFLQPPGTDPTDTEKGRWNRACIRCHTTRGVPGMDYMQMHTHVVEFGISCEACHGPGEQHIAFHKGLKGHPKTDDIVNPATLTHKRSTDVCGQCHLVSAMHDEPGFLKNGSPYRPGEDLSTIRNIGFSEHGDGHFWSDGVVRTSGREFNAVCNSACYQQGDLSCLSCHEMHQSQDDPREPKKWADKMLSYDAVGNKACVRCHTAYEDADQLTAHTHHAAGSSGSLCYNCHMPYTSYGLLKTSRSHQIDSPDVKNTIATGRPNACNLCHLDQSLGWTANVLQAWYGMKPPQLNDVEKETSAVLRWLLAGDAGQRAIAAWHMGWLPALEAAGKDWQVPHLAVLLEDPYDAVRYIAKRSLNRYPGFESFSYDFLCNPEQQREAREAAVQVWSETTKSIPENPQAVLFDGDGNLLLGKQQEVINSRSNRVIRLIE